MKKSTKKLGWWKKSYKKGEVFGCAVKDCLVPFEHYHLATDVEMVLILNSEHEEKLKKAL